MPPGHIHLGHGLKIAHRPIPVQNVGYARLFLCIDKAHRHHMAGTGGLSTRGELPRAPAYVPAV